MGWYNPSAPAVLGQEWVPVRPEPYAVDIGRETGHGFRLAEPTEISAGRFFLFAEPARAIPGQAVRMNIYPAGLEGASGPIRRAVVPVNSSAGSGSVGAAGGAATLTSAVTYASDGSYVAFGTGTGTLRMHFNTASTGTLLTGRRILAVNLLYALAGDLGALDGTTNFFRVGIGPGSLAPSVATWQYADASLLTAAPTRFTTDVIARLPCGDLNPWWDYPTQSWEDTSERLPWRRAELLRLESSASNPYGIIITSNLPATAPMQLGYVALEILHCAEQRVAYGATAYGTTPLAGPALNPYLTDDGPNTVVLRDTSFGADPVLNDGEYAVTVTVGDLGPLATLGSTPTINALRQLYPMPDQPGVTVSAPGVRAATELRRLPQAGAGAPTRVTTAVDDPAIVAEATDLLPHLTLVNDDGIVTAVHPYGAAFPAAVWDSQQITQQIANPVADGGTYETVRFYCRQFAASPLPLTVSYRAGSGGPVLATAQLLPAAFAALEEIVDGWKEVNLSWDTPVPITPDPANTPEVEWRSDGLPQEEQWQILTADGMGGSGGNTTGPATYGAPDGEDFSLIRTLSGTPTALTNVDAPLLLSQAPPEVTGLTVTVEELPLAGVGQECGLAPRGVPTAVYYHRVTWDPIAYPSQIIADTFRRTEVAQWGSADLGGAWTNVGGIAADFNVVDGVGGQHDIDNLGGPLLSVIGAGLADVQVLAEMNYSPGPVLTGGSLDMGIVLRYIDANNYYLVITTHLDGAAGGVLLGVYRTVAGMTTLLANTVLTGVLTSAIRLRATAQGVSLSVSLYDSTDTLLATTGATDSSHAAGAVGFYSYQPINPDPHTVTLSAFSVTGLLDPTIGVFGAYELQRADTVTGWETVATATSPDAAEFADFEARVGVESTYRIRACNARDFCGPWSDEAPSTIPAPGVVGACVDSGVLIFSSNVVQDGSAVLAYVQTWDSTNVAEVFDFPEAATAQLQRMLDRDYVVAFRPAERGGMRFTRTLLVQAAAVPIPVLDRGFSSLRDLAWQDLPYLAVRTEGADRWLSTVLVPQGVFRDLRRLQLATVEVVEVTDTPAAAAPGVCEGMVSRVRTVYAQTAYAAAFAGWSTGFDLRVRVRLDNWLVPGSAYVDLASNYHPDTGGGWAFTYYRGTMNLFVDDLSVGDTYDAAPILPEPGEMLWLRVVWVRDNGGGDSQAQFYTSPDGVTWTPAGGAQTSPFQPFATGTGPLQIGADPDLGPQNRGTTIAQASIADDTGTTVFASPDFTAHPAGTVTFVDGQGNLWELVGGGTCQR